ncbi:MAG: hypothetical protein K2P51_08865 [Rhabdochlamydiaceae bacterium]|nr:hypothetical protein [Rhabdochlamydiaceae bacterium]
MSSHSIPTQTTFAIKTTVYGNAIQQYEEQKASMEGEQGLLGRLGAFGLILRTRVSDLQNRAVEMPGKEAFAIERARFLKQYWELDALILKTQAVVQDLAEAAQFVLPKARDYMHGARLATHTKLNEEIGVIDQALARCSQELNRKCILLTNELRRMEIEMSANVKPEMAKFVEIADAQGTRSTLWRSFTYAASFVSSEPMTAIPQLTDADRALLGEKPQEVPSEEISTGPEELEEGFLSGDEEDGVGESEPFPAIPSSSLPLDYLPQASSLTQPVEFKDITSSFTAADLRQALSVNAAPVDSQLLVVPSSVPSSSSAPGAQLPISSPQGRGGSRRRSRGGARVRR